MELFAKLELFSRTIENRFVFNLFDLLLCGVILLVILRGRRSPTGSTSARIDPFLWLAFFLLGASFGFQAFYAGAFLFFERRFPELRFDVLAHALQASAWLSLAASAYQRPKRGQTENTSSPACRRLSALFLMMPFARPLGTGLSWLSPRTDAILDLTTLLILGWVLFLFHRRPLGKGNLATAGVGFLFLAAVLHFGFFLATGAERSVVLWNFEQFSWSLALFTFAFAIGETSQDLFDRVFVRLQIAFILLASVMILVITQTEKTEYLAGIRGRSDQLAQFVRAHVDYFSRRNQGLSAAVEQEDLLRGLTLGFANLPELKLVRISAGRQLATFEIVEDGAIHHRVEATTFDRTDPTLDPDDYFLIHAVPLKGAVAGQVEFFGARQFLNRSTRKRIVVIFSLFTGMVTLSTLMIGLVVRSAGLKIQRQAREIKEQQQQLLQASKLAALGELAAGVAHEVNNPATTILSRASFLLSDHDGRPSDEREDLSAIVSQAQRIAQITRNLLVFSRPQALDIRAVSATRILAGGLHPLNQLLRERRIAVEEQAPPDVPAVLADEPSLVRALENIFRNAIDAMPEGGTITIRAAKDEGSRGTRVILEISDTGIGIEPDKLARIFDPFFTTKEVGKGTGLGLSIVHGIIKEHGGSIRVESQLGAGTKFVIALPAEHGL